MNKLLVQLGRYGDLVNILPLLYHDFQKGERWSVMVAKEFANIFDGVSYADPIVFDGPMFQLDQAMAEAQKINPAAITCQLVGPTETIRSVVTMRNGMEYRATTESFLKDQWSIIGRANEWRERYPLVFDRRDKVRETKLCAEALPKNKKKNILVFTSGTSSPFPYTGLLIELLGMKFGKRFNIVDASKVKAERIYDLLGLMERAHCLICTDSAPLHLAYAVKVPVVAMVQDKPSLWHGSCWRENHIFQTRYRDFPIRATEMLSAIARIGEPGCPFNVTPAVTSQKIIHAWSQYEVTDENRERHNEARKTWLDAYETEDGTWVSTPSEWGVFGKDSKHMNLCNSSNEKPIRDEKRLPLVADVIRLAALRANDNDVICLTRADTCFTSVMGERLLSAKLPTFAFRRIKDKDGTTHHPAADLFAFTKKWWRENQSKYPNGKGSMLMGSDYYWNQVMLSMFRMNGATEIENAIYRLPSPPKEPPKSDQTPARVQHNEQLARSWIEANKPPPSTPAAHEQTPTFPLNRRGLCPYGYNPALIRHGGKLLMTYRWHTDGDAATQLAMAELDDKGNVIDNGNIAIQGVGTSEDARLFELAGELYMMFVVSTWPENPPKSVVKWGKLTRDGGKWSVPQHFQPIYNGIYGPNDGTNMQKNYVPFEFGGKAHFIYSCSPKQIVCELDGAKVVQEYTSDFPRWMFGPIKGGTPPIPHKGKWLRFFHGTLDNEPAPWRRRYYMGACLMESTPPFQTISLTQRPIITGSEVDELSSIERASCHHLKGQVVFPMGAVRDGKDFLVSYGVNDAACNIARISEGALKL